MPTLSKLLVYVDTERSSQPALERAAMIAGRVDAALELLTVVEPLPWYSRLLGTAPDLEKSVVREARERLERLMAPLLARGLRATARVIEGRRSLEVTRAVVAGGHDLLLKDAEADQPGALGTSDLRLMRSCPCPVWISRPCPSPRLGRVLAAVNPRPPVEHDDPLGLGPGAGDPGQLDPERENAFNDRILATARWAATLDGAELQAVHAWRVPGEDVLRGDPRVDQAEVQHYVRGVETEAEIAFRALLTRHEPIRSHLKKGKAAEVIAQVVAAESIDLLVLGTVARTGIAGYVIGNTAEAVLGLVTCSVLAVKPEGFVSPVALDPAGA